MTRHHRADTYRRLIILSGLLFLAACTSAPPRTAPLPLELKSRATVVGIDDARHWADAAPGDIHDWYTASDEVYQQRMSGIMGQEHHYLALSGGGENGAFTAGLLAGWTAAGDRPQFTMVTGVSTGALIAPYAFLGSDYDQAVKEVYTGYAAPDLINRRGFFNIINNDAVADALPMKAIIDRYMTAEVVEKIAAESRKGRMLFIGTTDMDAGRPVMWDIGAIAASGHPDTLALIRTIQWASASIPVGTPPVIIEVEADGKRYDEMHVDGGVTRQVFLYPLDIDWASLEKRLELPSKPTVYVIRNAYLDPHWEPVERKLIPITSRTIDSLIRTQGIGDIYRMYLAADRDGLNFKLAYIPAEYLQSAPATSGLEYMRYVYERAFKAASSGYPWDASPLGVVPDKEEAEQALPGGP